MFYVSKIFLVVYLHMPISTEHQGVIPSERICIHDTSYLHCFDSKVQKRMGCDIVENFDSDNALSFKNAKYRHFILCSYSSIAFSSTSKLALVHINLTKKEVGSTTRASYNRHSYCSNGFQHSWINQPYLLGYIPGRQLNNPKPIPTANMYSVNPSCCKITELVSTLLAS